MKIISPLFLIAALALSILQAPAQRNVRIDAGAYKPGNDIPLGIPHGTWDFDEWPGVDHEVKYRDPFMYNRNPGDKVKIDYTLSVFDENDHEGYLKTPDQLTMHGFISLNQILAEGGGKTIVGIFTHPDDEILLAGGLFAAAAKNGWKAKIYLVSNGADGSEGVDSEPSPIVGGYNSFGVMPNGKIRVDTDIKGQRKVGVIAGYARKLGVPISVMQLDMEIDGKKVVQVGETPGLDWEKTFGEGTPYRKAIYDQIRNIIRNESPDILITHGTNGEYNNFLHKTVNRSVIAAAEASQQPLTLFTAFPENNFNDHITHFVDLDENDKAARQKKFDAFKAITFLHTPGMDYDKPWNPDDDLMDGAFVKDYG